MKTIKLTVLVLFLSVLVVPSFVNRIAHSQSTIPADDTASGAQSPTTDAVAPATEQQAASQAATTDQANKVSGSDDAAANDPVDDEGVAAGTTGTFSYDNTDPADARTTTTTTSTDTTSTDTTSADTTTSGDSVYTVDQADAGFYTKPSMCPPAPRPGPAPADFDNKTNGLIPQGTPVPPNTDPTPGTFEADKFIFSEVDEIEDGLGPVYNAQSCRECHQNPVTGAISQINELRAGHNLYCNINNVCGPNPCPPPQVCTIKFVDAPGGSLINDRSIPTKNTRTPPFFGAKAQERVPPLYTAAILGGPPLVAEEKVRTFRTSLNTLGDGFVEAIANRTLLNIAADQSSRTNGQVHGQAIRVPVLESSGCDPANPATCRKRVGRFGWKDQHASLLSFSGDAYLNEIGITNFLLLMENTSLGRFVGFGSGIDNVRDDQPCEADPSKTCGEDTAQDIKTFAEFMRATKAPPQDPDIQGDARFAADVAAGRNLFSNMPGSAFSCSLCHVPKIQTAPPCTFINAGTFRVPNALGNKIIQPFGDFLLHDVGTGDFIVQNGGQATRTKVRTPPLWGVRTRDRLMHDGESLTFREAILRHSGEAQPVINAFSTTLSETQRRQLIMFLESL